MTRKPTIEFIAPEATHSDGSLIGGGTTKSGRDIYRVMLYAGHQPRCTINGEDYTDPSGQIDRVMWNLLVAVRTKFGA
jgi:hypothetical protein